MRSLYATLFTLMLVSSASLALAGGHNTAYQHSPAPMTMPVLGMSMDQVRAKFGSPRQIKGAVGQPPITRWVYEGYTVYFEYRHVIHSVEHRR